MQVIVLLNLKVRFTFFNKKEYFVVQGNVGGEEGGLQILLKLIFSFSTFLVHFFDNRRSFFCWEIELTHNALSQSILYPLWLETREISAPFFNLCYPC